MTKSHFNIAPSSSKSEESRLQHAPFEVVWRRLAFETTASAWDRCLNSCSILSVAKSLLGAVGATSSGRGPSSLACSAVSSCSSSVRGHCSQNPSLEQKGGSSPSNKSSVGLELGEPAPTNRADSSNAGPASGQHSSGRRHIFQNLNGRLGSHELTAILGPSGAGKTSLLNALCGRSENYRGLIELRTPRKRSLRLSIIPQKDYLIDNLTVFENLLYASRILNSSRRHFRHESNIHRVVKMLNLTNCLQSRVANISGGEYKRVSIAQELLSQPDILILDEPTSGLDSLNCKKLIQSLKQLIQASRDGAIQPIAIVMTIHQPDIEVFSKFDRVYCLAKGGRAIYEGRPADVMGHLREHVAGLAPRDQAHAAEPVGAHVNPANLLIEIASEDIYGRELVDRLANLQREQFASEQPELSQLQHQQLVTRRLSTEQLGLNLAQHQPFSPLRSGAVDAEKAAAASAFRRLQTKSKSLQELDQAGAEHQTTGESVAIAINGPHQQLNDLAPDRRRHQNHNHHQTTISPIMAIKSESQLVRDKRLSTTRNNDNDKQFLYHTYLLTKRAFKSTLRDPLMTLTSLIFHLCIPLVMWSVYSRKTGTVKACPIVERQIDMLSLAKNETMALITDLQDQLITALECSTMFFLSTYAFSMCSLSIAALTFPLNVHVLLKETRNGWYNLSSYVIAKTLASFPFEVLFPVISIANMYLLLGMPSAELEWRLWAIAGVMGLISMISHTQGLIFGALCMDSVQTAIFLASSLTLPQALLSGFTARIAHMPQVLQYLSWLSPYRYSSDCINIIRFGYGICECDSATEDYLAQHPPSFVGLPSNAQKMLIFQYRNQQIEPEPGSNGSSTEAPPITGIERHFLMDEHQRDQFLTRIENDEFDIFQGMAQMTTRSFSYGRQIDSCQHLRSQLLITTGAPEDHFLPWLLAGMIILLIFFRLVLFVVVKWKLTSRI